MRRKQLQDFGLSCRVSRNNNQSIPNNQNTAVIWNVERWDDSAFWTVGQPDRIFCPITSGADGTYLIGGSVRFAPAAGGTRAVRITVNGIEIALTRESPIAAVADVLQLSTIWRLNQGDNLQLIVTQTSGAALNIEPDPSHSPEFWLVKL